MVQFSSREVEDISHMKSLTNVQSDTVNNVVVSQTTSTDFDFNINIDTLLSLPNCLVYWKDLNGHFLGCNKLMASELELSADSEIQGLSDFDLPIQRDDASIYRRNDQIVLNQNCALEFQETAVLTKENKRVTYKSVKMPLVTKLNETIGTIGITSLLYSESVDAPTLSKRQKDCLYFAVLGYTMKEISIELGLSPKTVEHYINNVKNKLKCSSRSMLIQKALRFTFIKERMLNL